MLAGEVASLGNNFIVTLNAIDCGTGELLAGEQVEAGSKEEVLAALGTAITRMRGELGESLASVEKYDVPIEQATTPSLHALEAFSQGAEQRIRGKDFQAIPFFQRAIELDPEFTLAHARLGTAYSNTNQIQKAHEHWQRAYELLEGVSEPERLYVLAHYYNSLLGDRRKGTEIYEQWIGTYPRDWTPHNNLAVSLGFMGQYERELHHALEAARLGGDNAFARSNVFFAYFNLGRIDEARAALEETLAQGFGEDELAFDRAFLAAYAGDRDGLLASLESWTGTPSEPFKLQLLGTFEARYGRLAESRALARRQTELAANYSGDEGVAQAKLDLAYRLMDFGYAEEPVELAREAVGLSSDRGTLAGATGVLARLGDPAEVEALIGELERRWPQNTFVQEIDIPAARAGLALRDGDADEAIHVLETPRPFEAASLFVIQLRGEAYLQAGRPAEAVVEFEKLVSLDHIFPFWQIHSLAHLWLARAHLANGDAEAARTSYERFLEIMVDADEGIPMIEKARSEYATIPGVRG
jgi:tetratricopeptide (TPR) repeat protein